MKGDKPLNSKTLHAIFLYSIQYLKERYPDARMYYNSVQDSAGIRIHHPDGRIQKIEISEVPGE